MKGRGGQSGEYISAHVSQASRVYNQLIQSGVTVDGYQQRGETVYFRTAQPLPTHQRRRRWGLWIVGAVVAFFAVAAALKGGMVAGSTGVGLTGVILFGTLLYIVWKVADRPSVGFIGTTISGLIGAVLLIGVMTSVAPLWDEGAAAQQASIAAECGGIGGGDIACRWEKLGESVEHLIDVANPPASEGLGGVVLVFLALTVGGGWLYWKSQGLK